MLACSCIVVGVNNYCIAVWGNNFVVGEANNCIVVWGNNWKQLFCSDFDPDRSNSALMHLTDVYLNLKNYRTFSVYFE